MKTLDKAKILLKYFNLYGYGNFDLQINEITQIISILEQSSSEKIECELKELYERLCKTRLG